MEGCSNPATITARPVVDNDTATYIMESCISSGYALQAMDINTGDVVFTTHLGGINNTSTLLWFEDGVAVQSWRSLWHFDTAGMEVGGTKGGVDNLVAAHPDRSIVYTTSDGNTPEQCSVHIEDFSGIKKSEPIDCAVQVTRRNMPTPSGGAVIVTGLLPGDPAKMHIVDNGSNPLIIVPLDTRIPSYAQPNTYRVSHLEVDANGNIAIGATFKQSVVKNGNSVIVDRAIVDIYTPDGVFKSRWSSTSLGWDESFDINPYGYSGLGLAQDAIYVGSSVGSKVTRISAPGISLPYRDAVRWGVSTGATSEPLKYVALGDSFSSGEGLSPYIAGTDTSTNKCHRSESAFPYLVSESLGVNVELEAFVACAGAVMWHLDHDNDYDDGPQLDAISEDTDIVSVTIGGNDVGFVEFAAACVTGTCTQSSAAYNQILTTIDDGFTEKLESYYEDALSRIQKEDAKLLVVGYPQVAPNEESRGVPSVQCVGHFYKGTALVDGHFVEIPWGNATAAFDVTARINSAIEQAVHNVWLEDKRIQFVDVNQPGGIFEGRDVCSDEPLFENATLDPMERSFHPNSKGHEALAHYVRHSL